MLEPWVSVLDYACDWASGQATEYNVVWNITEKAYTELGKEYESDYSHAEFPGFDLTSFFEEDWADCRDMSAVVQVFTNALGGKNVMIQSISYESPDFFRYKPICKIGKDCEDPDTWYMGGYWQFHQFGYLNNVFDACIMIDKFNPRIPLNEPINGSYKDDLYDGGPGAWEHDSVRRYTYVY